MYNVKFKLTHNIQRTDSKVMPIMVLVDFEGGLKHPNNYMTEFSLNKMTLWLLSCQNPNQLYSRLFCWGFTLLLLHFIPKLTRATPGSSLVSCKNNSQQHCAGVQGKWNYWTDKNNMLKRTYCFDYKELGLFCMTAIFRINVFHWNKLSFL